MTQYRDYFANSTGEIPSNFILFCKIDTHVLSSTLNPDQPLYFGIDNDVNNLRLSRVTIDQYPGNQVKHIAWFYKSYNYTKGIGEIIENISNLPYYKIICRGEYEDNNNRDRGFNMMTQLYIDKLFILKMYEQTHIPKLLYAIMTDSCATVYRDKLDIEKSIYHTTLSANFLRAPYNYQKQNIRWMIDQEIRIDSGAMSIESFKKGNYMMHHIESIDEYLVFSSVDKKMINPEELDSIKINIRGGVLSDDIGLGKTFSMIGLINESKTLNRENHSNQVTLVICPRRLCLQWLEEIKKTCNLNIYTISSIVQFKKLNHSNINNYDIVIMSYQFLTNKKYLEYLEENANNIDVFTIQNYDWLRVILDEGHEYISASSKCLKQKHYYQTIPELFKIQSKYRWICSGTPYTNHYDRWQIINYLSTIDDHFMYNDPKYYLNLSQVVPHLHNTLHKLVYRKNTKDSVENQVVIPKPIIDTEFLRQSTIERAIYDSALGDKDKMIQLCNHILVSDQHINILGNDPLPLNEIHQKMTEYYDKRLNRLGKRLDNIKKQLEDSSLDSSILLELQDKKTLIENDLISTRSKHNIFVKLAEKLKEEEFCPVCYEKLEDLIKTVTPCGHFICGKCIGEISNMRNHNCNSIECPMCRNDFSKKELRVIAPENSQNETKLGTKMARLIEYSNQVLESNDDNRILIFSQWDSMLKLVSKVLKDHHVNHLILNGSMHVLNSKLRKFKLDKSIRIILLSMEKAASGLNLTEANYIVLLDTMNTDKESSRVIEEQAIGRSVRIGQSQEVSVKRFIMQDTIEHEYYTRNIS